MKGIVGQVMFQVEQYLKHGFTVAGVIGIDRSPICGVNTTSMDDQEVNGEGVFIEALREGLDRRGIQIHMVGIKVPQMESALASISELLGNSH